jgi:hypothetical protein
MLSFLRGKKAPAKEAEVKAAPAKSAAAPASASLPAIDLELKVVCVGGKGVQCQLCSVA